MVDNVAQTPRLAQVGALPGNGGILTGENLIKPAAGTRLINVNLLTAAGTVDVYSDQDPALLIISDWGT
jgi:hypothetical protein